MNKIKTFIRKILSKEFLLFLRFIRKIPSLYSQHKISALVEKDRSITNRIIVKGDKNYYPIFCPDEINNTILPNKGGWINSGYIRTYNIFLHQASAFYMRREIENFVRFAKTKRKFADIGSAEGFYSALFASIHNQNAEILSVDCFSIEGSDPEKTKAVIEENKKRFNPKRWDMLNAYICDTDLTKNPSFPVTSDTRLMKLEDIFNEKNFHPEIIKFDVESSEYEILMCSIDYLRKHKPILIIEVHIDFLKEQGLDFNKVFKKLTNIGYKLVAKDTRRYLQEDSHIILS